MNRRDVIEGVRAARLQGVGRRIAGPQDELPAGAFASIDEARDRRTTG